MIESAFERGLTSKLYPAVVYDEVFKHFLSEEAFGAPQRAAVEQPEVAKTAKTREHEDLRWNSEPGPTYSSEKADEFLRNRYEVLIGATRLTLPRVLADDNVREVITSLREEGWLDWQVLSAIWSVSMNWRTEEYGTPPRSHEERFQRMKEPMEVESSDLPDVPLSLFTRESLTQAINMSLPAVLATWGLELRRRTPDLRAIGRFLDVRYSHSTDDVEHEDVLGAAAR